MLSPRRVAAVNAVLIAALLAASLFLARDAVRFAFGRAEDVAPQTEGPGGRPERPVAKPLKHYEPLLKDNVFGFPPGRLVPLSSSMGEGPTAPPVSSGINITLSGTVAWSGGFGYAFVSGPKGQELYKTGDYIPGAGRLKRVEAHRVVVESGSREVEVGLAEITKTKAPAKGGAQGGKFARMTSTGTYVMDRKAVDESIQNPKRMLTDARLLPNIVEGRQEGFVMSEVRSGGLYHTLGLRNGDVLLRVNDFDLSSAESGLQAFTALRGMDRIELDILRNGGRMTLTYIIR
jgi:general secretion pathway protein C